MPKPRHFITRSHRYTKKPNGERHFGWSVRAVTEGYDPARSQVVCTLDVSDRTLRHIEGLLYTA